MAIFSRRQIQTKIDSLSEIIPRKKLQRLVKHLNLEYSQKKSEQYVEALSAEWEIVLVDAFAKAGSIQYERRASNGKEPDIYFRSDKIMFLGDIFAVSDESQKSKNPINLFHETIYNLWIETGLESGGLKWEVEALELARPNPTTPPSDKPRKIVVYNHKVINRSIPRLLLPPEEFLEEWCRKKLRSFFELIRPR